jgi:excisionase family DNA binding protein
MPKVTTVEAAQMAGVSRSTIWRACKTGRLSAERTGKDFLVEVSELGRVFPLKVASSHETLQTVAAKPDATDLVAELRRQIERLERQVADLQQERDRLLGLIEKQSVALITDQRPRSSWLQRWLKRISQG